MTNLVSQLREVVRAHPDQPALSVAGNETSYAQLWAMTGQFAAALVERGVEPGDPVALYLPNLPQYVVAFHGVLRAGAVVVPVDSRYEADDVRPLLTDSGAGAVVTTTDRVPVIEAVHEDTRVRFIVTVDGDGEFSTGFTEFLQTDADFDFWELAGRADDDVAVVVSVPVTTDGSEAVELTHGDLADDTRAVVDAVPGGIGPGDSVLGAVPFFDRFGETAAMNAALLAGGTLHPLAPWDAGRALTVVETGSLDVLQGTPGMYADMVDHPDAADRDLSGVRFAGVEAHPVAGRVADRFEDQFGVALHEMPASTGADPATGDGPSRRPDAGEVVAGSAESTDDAGDVSAAVVEGVAEAAAETDEDDGAADAQVPDGRPDEIEAISGVGPAKSETLRQAGYESVADVVAASQDELSEVDGIGPALAEQIKTAVEDDA